MADDERFEQIAIAADADKVAEARETGILRDVQIMGFESKNGYFYDPEAIKENRARFEGMTIGLDHDYKLGPLTLTNTWGTMKDVAESGRRGNIHFNREHARTNEILEDVARGTRPVALSPVCGNCVEQTRDGKRFVTKFEATRLDVVVGAATNRTMFNQSGDTIPPPTSPQGPMPPPDPRLEQALKDIDSLKAQLKKLEATAPATVAKTVERMEQDLRNRGVDLDKFHDEFLKAK